MKDIGLALEDRGSTCTNTAFTPVRYFVLREWNEHEGSVEVQTLYFVNCPNYTDACGQQLANAEWAVCEGRINGMASGSQSTMKRSLCLRMLRDVQPWEEILVDYNHANKVKLPKAKAKKKKKKKSVGKGRTRGDGGSGVGGVGSGSGGGSGDSCLMEGGIIGLATNLVQVLVNSPKCERRRLGKGGDG